MRRRSILLSLVLPLALGSCISSNPDFCDDPATCSESDGILSWGDDLSQPSSDLASAGSDLAGSNQDMSDAAIDLSKPGPSSIIRFDRKVTVGRSTIDITVIGPSDDGKEITKKGTPLPWVILSPGFATDHKQYQGYGDRLASYGIVTILQKSPSELNHATYRDETVQLITWLLSPSGMGAERLSGRLDKDRLGLIGHSLGGKISFLVAQSDSRVKALLGISVFEATLLVVGSGQRHAEFVAAVADPAALDALLEWARRGPPAARVLRVDWLPAAPPEQPGFHRESTL